MTADPTADTIAALRELIDAVDRRVPLLESVCESRVAQTAAALRVEAAARLEELSPSGVGPDEKAQTIGS